MIHFHIHGQNINPKAFSLRSEQERRQRFLTACLVSSGMTSRLDALHDGFDIHLCAQVLNHKFNAGNRLVALGLGDFAKLVRLGSMIGDIQIA